MVFILYVCKRYEIIRQVNTSEIGNGMQGCFQEEKVKEGCCEALKGD